MRRVLSAAEQDAIWSGLRSGGTISRVARQLGRPPSTVRTFLHRSGGIRPRPRHRAADRLRREEREELSRGLAAGESLRAIAARLGRAPSTPVSGGGPQRRPGALPGRAGRAGRLGPGLPAEAGQAGGQPDAARTGDRRAEAAMVPGADRWLAQGGVPRPAGDVGVPRDDLPVAVRGRPAAPSGGSWPRTCGPGG
jgi:transposase-like protein